MIGRCFVQLLKPFIGIEIGDPNKMSPYDADTDSDRLF